jgi:FkbM family methyltransferase
MAAIATRLGQLRVLRRVKHHPRVERAWDMGFRSRLVRERARFTAAELSGFRGTGAYRLAGSGLAVHLRHGTSDLDILEEVFGMRLYAMPEEVREALADARPLRAVDLGGHVGLFGLWLLGTEPDARVTVVEADPANAAVLRRTIAANGATGRWTLVEGVAAATGGQAAFRAGGFAESAIAAAADADAVTLPAVDALELLARADLAKVDIEGGEWPILADPRLAATPLRALALEHHPRGAPALDHTAAAHRLLRDAGFQTRDIAAAPVGAGMLWAWRA